MNHVEKSISGIMSTAIYLYIGSDTISQDILNNDVEYIENELRAFGQNFSRFIPESELSKVNEAEGIIKVSADMFKMLELGLNYQQLTHGLFDITILPLLLAEGYVVSKDKGFIDEKAYSQYANKIVNKANHPLELNNKTLEVRKGKEVKIDLGGIGKGYIVEKLSQYLSSKYVNFCLSAGGDMYCAGRDTLKGYPYWAIEVENTDISLMLNNLGIATSGIDKRKWLKGNEEKNHIINPQTGKSVATDVLTCTVINPSVVYCDVYAKTLLLMGVVEGIRYSNDKKIPAVFVDKNSEVHTSQEMNKYVWQA